MTRLIKIELSYFKFPLGGILLLLLIFTAFAVTGTELFNDVVFLRKYLWSIVIGLGSYGLVFILWMQRVKEKHERIHFLLPTSIETKKWSRWIFAVLPFVFVMVYIQILQFFLSDNWSVHIGRISAQIGFLSMALAVILVVRDIWFVTAGKSDLYKILIASLVSIIAAAGALLIIAVFNYNVMEPLYIHQEELFFFIWGILISSMTLIFYDKRKNYLE